MKMLLLIALSFSTVFGGFNPLILNKKREPEGEEYWEKAGKFRRLASAKDSKKCIYLMWDKKTGEFNCLEGDYEPVEAWEYEESDIFFFRILYPIKRNNDEFANYFKSCVFNWRMNRVKAKIAFNRNKATWDDLIYVFSQVHPQITPRQLKGLSKRAHLLPGGRRAIGSFIFLMIDYCMEASISEGYDLSKKGLGRLVNSVKILPKNRVVKQIGTQVAYEAGMTSLRQFVSTLTQRVATLGSQKKQLQFLDLYKEKIEGIEKHNDLINFLGVLKGKVKEGGDLTELVVSYFESKGAKE